MKKVKCIRNDGSAVGKLVLGQVYEVATDNGSDYILKGVDGWCGPGTGWVASRFVEVADTAEAIVAGSMVECIDGSSSGGDLVVGKIYQVKEVRTDNNEYWIVGITTNSWNKKRFKLVSAPTTTAKKPAISEDEEERRLRRLLMPSVAEDECCMGACKKAVCWIHKGT